MKEESVRVKNGCGKLLRACFSAKVSIKEGWKGLAEVILKGRGWGKRRCRWPMWSAAVFADQRGAVVCPRSLAHRRSLVGGGRGGGAWAAGPPHNLHPRPRAFSAARPATHRLFSAS